MSKLNDTKQAYEKIEQLIAQELLKKGSNSSDLQRFRDILKAAFYLLGWGQFEHLISQEAREKIDEHSAAKTTYGVVCEHVLGNYRSFPVIKRLEILFRTDPKTLSSLGKNYEVRNEVTHNYKALPKYVGDLAEWLEKLETLVDDF